MIYAAHCARRSRSPAKLSSANGALSTALSPTAWRKQASASSYNGSAAEPVEDPRTPNVIERLHKVFKR